MKMRILFAGTPDCAVPALKALAKKFTICGVLTNPPAPCGRSKKLQDSKIAEATKDLKNSSVLPNAVPVLTPTKLDDDFREQLKKLAPDLLVCFAYGKIFGKKTMEIFPLGGINIHPSLLPLWRGSAPIPYAIMSGADETGVTIQTIAQKTDTGNILSQQLVPIEVDDTTETLLSKCSESCIPMLLDTLENFTERIKNAKIQNEKNASYSHIIKKEDGLIDWSNSAKNIDKKIKAFTPWPGCFSYVNNEKINIIKARLYKENSKELMTNKTVGTIIGVDKKIGILVATGSGILAISVLQRQAKKKLFWKDFLNGNKNFLSGRFEKNNL